MRLWVRAACLQRRPVNVSVRHSIEQEQQMTSALQDEIAFWLGLDASLDERARGIMSVAADHDISTFIELVPEEIRSEIKKRVESPPKSVDEIRLLRSYNLRPEAFVGLNDRQIDLKLCEEENREKAKWFKAICNFHNYFYTRNA